MKKMAKQLFVAAVALTAFTACSENAIAELDPTPVVTPETTSTMRSAVLTDANGQQITSVSADMGTYYLDIKTDGVWYIETPHNMEFTPAKMCGIGNERVKVFIGNNWSEDVRQLSYKVNFLDGSAQSRRAGETEQTVSQTTNLERLARFKEIFNSNLLVGFGYNPLKGSRPEMCTGAQIFKMSASDANVTSSTPQQAREDYFYAHSEDVLDKVISVNGHPGGNFNVVKFDLDLDDVTVTRKNSFEVTIMQKSLTRAMYCREIAWLEMMETTDPFTAGFKTCKQRVIDQIRAAGSDEAKKQAAELFIHDVGSHFVKKATLGQGLDYRMAVAKSKATKATNVKAALDFKWTQQVKDTSKVDSAQLDSLKKLLPESARKNFVFHGGVQVTDSAFSAASATSAQMKARGGDVALVSILATGGTINCADLAKWLLSIEPENAVITELDAEPIYRLFKDTGGVEGEADAYTYLKNLIDTKYNLKPAQDNFGTIIDD